MGRKKRGGPRPNQQSKKPTTVELAAPDEWDDLENHYLSMFRKKIRNTRKKLDKMEKLKEKGRENLNEDQLKTLNKLQETRVYYNTIVHLSDEAKQIAKALKAAEEPAKEPTPEEKQEEVPDPSNEAQQEAPCEGKKAPAPELSDREKLLALFHVSNVYQHTWESQKSLLNELREIGIKSNSEELNGLKTISHLLQGQLYEDGVSPKEKFQKACVNTERYLAMSPEILEVAGIPFERLRTVAEAVLRTKTWRSSLPNEFEYQMVAP